MSAVEPAWPRIDAVVLTCRGREAVLAKTLDSLRRTDWGEEPTVFLDRVDDPDPEVRQIVACKLLLADALTRPWDHLLFLEDDVAFNRHLRHNLETWWPLRAGRVRLASLYAPPAVAFPVRGERFAVADPRSVYGSQAMILSRACAAHIHDRYDDGAGKQDLRFAELAGPLGPVFYHSPSLVQHVGRVSVWGGIFHEAADYDPEYRA